MAGKWFVLIAAAVTLAFAGGSGKASASSAGGLTRCGTLGVVCKRVSVPLDWSGHVPGSLSLSVEEFKPKGPSRGVMFLMAGGPGQASTALFDISRWGRWASLFPGYTLVSFDPRGTGASDPLSCSALSVRELEKVSFSTLVGICADQLGVRRNYFGTSEDVRDIDAIRKSLGFRRIGLYGVSYGTDVALTYARTFPTHVTRLMLDSVASPITALPVVNDVLREIPHTLNSYCAQVCGRTAPRYGREVVTLANALAAKPLHGTVLAQHGARRRETLTAMTLLELVLQTDLDPGEAAELPAAVHAALKGSPQPLLRVEFLVTQEGGVALDNALSLATTCDDGPFPWQPDTPIAQRPAMLTSAIARVPARLLGGFGSWAETLGNADLCLNWPVSSIAEASTGGTYPDVPVLAVTGANDIRSPGIEARAVLASFPHGHLLTITNAGHAAFSDTSSTCAISALRNWLDGKSVPTACHNPRELAPVAAPLATPTRSPAPTPKQTLSLVDKTLHEAAATGLMALSGGYAESVPGPRGGWLTVPDAGGFLLSHYSLEDDLSLSGNIQAVAGTGQPLRLQGVIRVAVNGRKIGVLAVNGGALTGTLGTEQVTANRFAPPAKPPRIASHAWSDWAPPPGATAAVTNAIARHVAGEYRLDSQGANLVEVSDGMPTSPKDKASTLSTVAVQTFAEGTAADDLFHLTVNTWAYRLCGRGPNCSIPGTPSISRGRLVRREALEIALDTFAYAPDISSILVYLPPPPGTSESNTQGTNTLYFQRNQLGEQLARPLNKTLTLASPPLPSDPDTSEAREIDALTFPHLFNYFVGKLADGTSELLLFPSG